MCNEVSDAKGYGPVYLITYTRFVTFTGNLTSTGYLAIYGSVKRNLFSQLSSSHLLTLCGKQKCMVSRLFLDNIT